MQYIPAGSDDGRCVGRQLLRLLLCSVSVLVALTACTPKESSDAAEGAEESPEQRDEAQDAGNEVAQDSDADADAARRAEIDAAWRLDALRTALIDEGWTVDETAPEAPSVSTPDGTEVQGVTIEREGLRADVFLYVYPRAGYAAAHARAQDTLGGTAIVQRAERLIAVVGRDTAHAQEVLEALPEVYGHGTDAAP